MGNLKIFTGKKFKIESTTLFQMDEEFNDPRYMRVKIAVCHTGLNLNNSFITKETMLKAADSLKNIPILADVIEKEDGTYDYAGHTMTIVDDAFNEGEQRIYYIEKVVGIVPESNEFELVYDEESENYYVFVTAFLYRDYGNYTVDILNKRGGQTDVSCEIYCNEISYNANEKYTCIDDFIFTGVTLLGADVSPAMVGANAKTFSKLSDTSKEKEMLVIMKELTAALNNFNKTNASKGGKRELTKFEELLAKYNKTIEDIEFEYDGLSDEDLETKFIEAFGNDGLEDFEEGGEESDSETKELDEGNEEELGSEDEPEEGSKEFDLCKISSAVKFEDGHTNARARFTDEDGDLILVFKISHEDIKMALYELLTQYEELDNEWYFIDVVYDDSFEYMNWNGSRIYRQDYTVEEEVVSLKGDRIELYQERLTPSEKAALDDMRENYSYIASESQEIKEAILNSEEYEVLSDNEDFKNLKANVKNYSIKEIKRECKLIFADHVLSQGSFSLKKPKEKKKISFSLKDDESQIKKPYGSLFDSIKKE